MNKIFLIAVLLSISTACNLNSSAEKAAELTQKLTDIDKDMGGANVTDKAKASEYVKTSEELAALVEKTY